MMDKLDVADILKKYSDKARQAKSTKQLREIVRSCKSELDLRQIRLSFISDEE